ncbi:hypothetical protein Q3O59_08710 [Alkalimonas delamerensis]|uniref:Extracellular solute-binding protein, family 3 n=1 Tax=Alkalimonas delamerensis TaxID=265981 RepID=A0ABT9GQ69_9GAMM|nr:hypothetical protein [Alkalimonas delamerensis]MDP4529109.1 hypothetical protein [Alkalimonas delamerensis]
MCKWVWTALLLCSATRLAAEPMPVKNLVISYSDHPYVMHILNPLLQAAYKELGYQVEFVQADGARAHTLFQRQLVDADSGRTSYWLAEYDAELPVIWLDTLQLSLYCRQEIPCNAEILQDPRVFIVIPAQESTYQQFQLEMNARPYFVSGFATAEKMLLSGRVDYLLWVEGQLLSPLNDPNLQRATGSLRQFDVYHVLHSHHQTLLPELEAAVRLRIQAFTENSGGN